MRGSLIETKPGIYDHDSRLIFNFPGGLRPGSILFWIRLDQILF